MIDRPDYDPGTPHDSDAPQWLVELLLFVVLFPGLFIIALWLVGSDLSCNDHPDCESAWFVTEAR